MSVFFFRGLLYFKSRLIRVCHAQIQIFGDSVHSKDIADNSHVAPVSSIQIWRVLRFAALAWSRIVFPSFAYRLSFEIEVL